MLLLNFGVVEHSGLITKLNTSRCFHYWEVWFSWPCPRVRVSRAGSRHQHLLKGKFLLLKSDAKSKCALRDGGRHRECDSRWEAELGNWCLKQMQNAILESLERKGQSGNTPGWSKVRKVRASPSTQRGCFLGIREKGYQSNLLTTLLVF